MFTGLIALGIMEDILWQKHLAKLPFAEQIAAQDRRDAFKEKRRLEAIDERRHQEMCAAIRSTARDY